MTITILLFGVLLAGGFFFLAADLLHLPTIATQKAMITAGRSGTATSCHAVKPKTTDALLHMAAVKLSAYLPMDEYKKSRMKHVLSAAGLSETPELFLAKAIVKSVSISLAAIPCLMVIPLLVPVVLFLAMLIYFKEIRKADKALSAKRNVMEAELPRFEARFNSPILSDITRGLIGVLRGLGYPAWGGNKTTPASNAEIKSSLGLGIVRFSEKPEEPQISTFDYEYRVNTEVITAVRVSGGAVRP